jgi:hypothetical protein
MPSIKEIQRKLAEFNKSAQRIDKPEGYAAAWKRIFGKDLSGPAAKGFAQYYREMRSKRVSRTTRRRRNGVQRGGVAPVNYVTVPGILSNTFGTYPVEVDTDPASLDALSGGVYPPNMSIPLSKPGFWPTVPADMGSNKVGGGTRRRHHRGQRGGSIASARELHRGSAVYRYVEEDNAIYDLRVTAINNDNVTFDYVAVFPLEHVLNNPEFDTQRSELQARFPDAEVVINGGRRRSTRRERRRSGRKQRGGNLMSSLTMRPIPYISTPYPNLAQVASHNLSGATSSIPAPPSPVQHTWQLMGAAGAPISPGVVTPISSDFSQLARPAPWQTTN